MTSPRRTDFTQPLLPPTKSHVDQLHGHHRSLTAIGDKGHAAAATFSSTDESEEASIVAAGAAFEGS